MSRIAWVLWAGLALLFGWSVSRLSAQTLPPPADYYEVGVFRSTDTIGPTATPFTTTRLTVEMLSCNHRKSDDPANNVPNPTTFLWDDPDHPGMECRVLAPGVALSLPLGVSYRAAVRAVTVGGAFGSWSYTANTFRRAPRGLPCPAGQPGVMVSGEADLNGRPVQVQLCVNQ